MPSLAGRNAALLSRHPFRTNPSASSGRSLELAEKPARHLRQFEPHAYPVQCRIPRVKLVNPIHRSNYGATLLTLFAVVPLAFAQNTAPFATTPAAPLAFDVISIHPTKSVMTTDNNGSMFSRIFIGDASPTATTSKMLTLKYIISKSRLQRQG